MNNKKLKLAASPLKEMARYSEAMTGEKAAPTPAGAPWAAAQGENAFPMGQKVVLKEILPQREDCKTFVFGPDEEAGQKTLATFAPGQHISLTALVGGCPVSRPYTLVSTPGQARKGEYRLTIKTQGLLSRHMVEQARVGDKFAISGPGGGFVYSPLRDAPHLVALASGSGVAAFVSMAGAVREGSLNAKLTLLYTCPWQDGFLHKKELDELAGGGVEVRYYCPDCLDGSLPPLTAAEIEKAAGEEDYSLFWCGSPEAAAWFENLAGTLKKRPRTTRGGEGGVWCAPAEGKGFTLKIHSRTVTYTIAANPGETLLTAMERAGIAAPVRCRGGRCGFCRSRWLKGEYEVPEYFEERLAGEEEAGWLHPCCSFPLSDMEFEIFPV